MPKIRASGHRPLPTLAQWSEEPGFTTRTFLSEPMRAVHRICEAGWNRRGMHVSIDHAGNLRGCLSIAASRERRGSSSVRISTRCRTREPFDGILGVVLGVALVEICGAAACRSRSKLLVFRKKKACDLASLSSAAARSLAMRDDLSCSRPRSPTRSPRLDWIRARIGEARASDDALGISGVSHRAGAGARRVSICRSAWWNAISGQSRLEVIFEGKANHAGTTPDESSARCAGWGGGMDRRGGA